MKYRWDKKYLYWGITAFCVVVVSALVIWIFGRWNTVVAIINFLLGILAPIIAALVIAYLLNPILRFFERTCFIPLFTKLCKKKPQRVSALSRGFSVGVTLGLAIGLIAGLGVLILPEFYYSLEKLVGRLPDYLKVLIDWVEGLFKSDGNSELEQSVLSFLKNATDYLSNWIESSILPQANTLLTEISNGVISVVRGLVNFIIGLTVSVYVMYNKEQFASQGRKLLCALFKPKRVKSILRSARYLNKSFGEYFTGVLLNSLIIGVCCAIFMVCFNMPYAALVTVIVTVTNVIPFFGPFIGAIPSALLILMESPVKCLVFVIFIFLLQFLEGNIVSPKILGGKTGLSGFWVVFAILVGGGLFGFVGMICAVPVFSFLYFVIRNFCNQRLREKRLPTDTAVYSALRMLNMDPDQPGMTGVAAEAHETEEAPAQEVSEKTEE